LLRSEPIFYTLSGVFAGGAVERIASILAGHANVPQGVLIPDIIWALPLIGAGLFFALVADETEKYEALVTRQTDLVRLMIVVDVSQKKQHLSQENLVAFIEDATEKERKPLEAFVQNQEREWYSRAIRRLLLGIAFIAVSVLGPIFF
jgi:hypothetical protein